MKDNIEDVIASIKVEQVLVAILNTVGEVKVPTEEFFKTNNDDYEMIMSYDDEVPSFIFSVRNKNERN